MIKRDPVSETMLPFLMFFTSVLLMIMPGALLWFFLPAPIGFIAMMLCGIPGPAFFLWLDRELYGPR